MPTPWLHYHFDWKVLSLIVGVTWWNFYFRLFPGAIRSPQVVQFLRHVLQHLRAKLLPIWDALPTHRSQRVNAWVAEQEGRLELVFLPAYAAELNAVQYPWGCWRQYELRNFCPYNLGELSDWCRSNYLRPNALSHAVAPRQEQRGVIHGLNKLERH